MNEKMKSIVMKQKTCDVCGHVPECWDERYSDGEISLCPDCFEKFSKEHPVICHHYPGFVDASVKMFYQWKGCQQFLIDNPSPEGWRYVHSDNLIMTENDDDSEWWVLWHVLDEDIMNEIRRELPKWTKGRKEE